MYLIMIDDDGSLRLTNHNSSNVPRYAILSHTWGAAEEEVSFHDLESGAWNHKKGAIKLSLCKFKAREDSLRHFWIDTCCINKANHSELAEAIVSMFSWYREAAKCYVYLADVSVKAEWSSTFTHSRWFTRGWTLQELLAPKSVEFFSAEKVWLGDRNTLEDSISDITGIPVRALRGRALSEYKVEERMGWARSRQTTREEDQAYCLQGLFGVVFSPIYGEGSNSAFRRLYEEIGKRAKQIDFYLEAHSTGSGKALVSTNGTKTPVQMQGQDEQQSIGSVEHHTKVLKRNEEYLGYNHPDTLSSLDDLGIALQQHGDFYGAANHHRRALRYREQLQDYHNARSSLVRLASSLYGLKKPRNEVDTWTRANELYIYTRDVGGNGGHRFTEMAAAGLRVEELRFWYNDYCITGVELYYNDGSRGRQKPSGSEFTSYEFEPGETITELTMWTNHANNRLGCIQWKTLRYLENGQSSRKRFHVGADFTDHTSYKRAETGTGILVGLHGRVGFEIDSLGFIFLCPQTAHIAQGTDEVLNGQVKLQQLYHPLEHESLVYMDGMGGCGGARFHDVAEMGSAVRAIHFWQQHGVIKALQVELHNGARLPKRGGGKHNYSVLEFAERDVVKDIELWTRGEDRIARIQVTVYNNETCIESKQETGPWLDEQNTYQRDVNGGGVLVGVYGYAGDDVDWVGFVFRRAT